MQYILFDVDKIKDYVFESFKPREVKGASELIKCLDYYSKNRMGELMRILMEVRFLDCPLFCLCFFVAIFSYPSLERGQSNFQLAIPKNDYPPFKIFPIKFLSIE